MPNGTQEYGGYDCPGLVEHAKSYVAKVKELESENDRLRRHNELLQEQLKALKKSIKLLKE